MPTFLETVAIRRRWDPLTTVVHEIVVQNLDASFRGGRWGNRMTWGASRAERLRTIGKDVGKAIRNGDDSLLANCFHLLTRYGGTDFSAIVEAYEDKNGSLEHFECAHCGNLIIGEPSGRDEDDDLICENCTDHYTYSEVMGCWIHSDHAWPIYYSARAISRGNPDDFCTRQYGTRSGNLMRPPNEDCYFVDEDTYSELDDSHCDDDGDDYRRDDSVLAGYHEGREIGHIPSSYDKGKVWMGLELEIECGENSRTDIASGILSRVNTDGKYVRFETDGSLNYGIELITGYTGLDVHERWLKRFSEANLNGCKSHNTDTCGLHVHIDKAGMTPFEAARLMLFIHDRDNEKLIRAVARRYGTNAGYAKVVNKTEKGNGAVHAAAYAAKRRNRDLCGLNYDRYEALNFQPARTIEYRLFRGTLKVETIMACLEFTWLSYFFAKQTSIRNLKTEDFIRYINLPENRRESRYLRKLLAAKGLMPSTAPAIHIEAEAANDDAGTPPAPRARRVEREAGIAVAA